MIRFRDDTRNISLGVGDLLEIAPPGGDLYLPGQGTRRIREGQEAHRRWQRSREQNDSCFRSELSVSCTLGVQGWTCNIAGRIDGVSREGDTLVVEELKTTHIPGERLESFKADDVRAWSHQLKIYIYLLELQGLAPLVGRLLLISALDGWQRVMHVSPDPGMGVLVHAQLKYLVEKREDLLEHRSRRRQSMVLFAHREYRRGQRRIVEQVEKSMSMGDHLLLTAPTGVGKTAAVLQGALQAAYESGRQVFFATARGTQQRLAEATLACMADRGVPLRSVTLMAREKICPEDPGSCHPDLCHMARAYHGRLREKRSLARLHEKGVVTRPDLLHVAFSDQVCPHRLALDLVDGADVVVGDYNYVFDPFARLSRFETEAAAEWLLLVDEVHNLPGRGRSWYSPGLSARQVREAREALVQGGLSFQSSLSWLEAMDTFLNMENLDVVVLEEWDRAGHVRVLQLPHERIAELHDEMLAMLRDYGTVSLMGGPGAGDSMGSSALAPWEGDAFQDLTREFHRFAVIADLVGPETVLLQRPFSGMPGLDGPCGPTLEMLCRDAAPLLSQRFSSLAASTCFSATMLPRECFGELIGLEPERTVTHAAASPFPPGNLLVVIARGISTKYRHRDRDRLALASLLDSLVVSIPGNCAIMFPSFAEMQRTAANMEHKGRKVLVQTPRMDEGARDSLVNELLSRGDEPCVLLGALGGIFGEGLDLPGEALLGVIVVGPGLPPYAPSQELIKSWHSGQGRDGFEMAYVAPGMTRVVQAAGRVVRSETEKGVVVLVGERFLQHRFQDFFPADWCPVVSPDPAVEVGRFFQENDGCA